MTTNRWVPGLQRQNEHTAYDQLYRYKNGICDIPYEGVLELYPRGYTQIIKEEHVQSNLRSLFRSAKNLGTIGMRYPFPHQSHQLKLVADSSNIHDKHAILIVFEAKDERIFSPLQKRMILGWIPRIISNNVYNYLHDYQGGRIAKINENWHKKFYCARVALAYNNEGFKDQVVRENRFTNLIE